MPDPDGDTAGLLCTFLAERDAPCPSCGYNLRGLTAGRCPECSQELTLRVNLVEPRLAAWVTGLVGLAAGAGFSGMLVVFGLWMSVARSSGSPDGFFPFTVGAFVVEGALLLVWVRTGHAIRRRSASARGWLAAGCWLLTTANLAAFCALMS